MGVLEESLVGQLLTTSASYKRDIMEGRIRTLLGAEAFTQVTGLPARRGAADGGIDGTVKITVVCNGAAAQEERAALNIKVRQTDFTREQLGGFLLDMDREGIKVGVILTAAHLSPDAKFELLRKNKGGEIRLFHIRLSDILSGDKSLPDVYINGRRIDVILADNIREIINSR